MKSYKVKRKLGIDDLLCEFAFVGNSQGDTSVSNNIEDYKASGGWMSFIFDNIDINDQNAINEESIRRYNSNMDYIEKLKREGRYGQEYEISVNLHPHPSFDTPTNKGGPSLESYRMVFIDTSQINNEN